MREPNQGTGTITLRGQTLRDLLSDITKSLIYHGFNKIIFVNFHGSNIKVIDEFLRTIRYQTGALVAFYQHHFERQYKLIQDLVKGPPEETPGWHAGEIETSMILAYDAKLVHMDRAVKDKAHAPKWLTEKFSKTDGSSTVVFEDSETTVLPMEHYEYSDTSVIGNPFRATKEEGEKIIERMSTHLAHLIDEVKKIKVTAKTREFSNRA
jgi:creatinine amidohydrolase